MVGYAVGMKLSIIQQSHWLLLGFVLLACSGCSPGLIDESDQYDDYESAASQEAEDSGETNLLYSDDAFRKAALDGRIEVIRSALGSGTDVNAMGPDGRIALQLAAFNGHTPIVELLLKQGADIEHLDGIGRTALMYAATADNVDTVKALLAADAKVNVKDNHEGFTALMFAAAEGQAEIVKLLLEAGADPNAEDIDGEDSRLFARQKNHQAVLAVLDEFEAKK